MAQFLVAFADVAFCMTINTKSIEAEKDNGRHGGEK
jgi:hypothetical protein